MTFILLLLALQARITDTLWTETTDGYRIAVQYPEIALDNEGLGDILEEYATARIEEFKSDFERYHTTEFPTQDWSLEINLVQEPSPKGIICILAWVWEYTGGAHGNTATRAFNYNIADDRLLSTIELLGSRDRFESFAAEVISRLMEEGCYEDDWVEDGASAEEQNYHTVLPVPGEDCGLKGYTVLFPPYQVDCYASGTIEVFLPADWDL
ncbi:DUF4163 domain-containing protein [Candidatus Fermentibacteria bacterium]|nr:DUF4163 domain-containing protein [Candidatus Fermentibacteria bacterium]